jgi:large subunit ribosomal protein L22
MAERRVAVAISRGVTQTPRKVSLVAALVRGRSVADASVILAHTPKRAAEPLLKVIASATANATHTMGLVESSLVIKSLQVTSGSRLKRFRPAARGRALPFEKRTSHIRAVVEGEVKPKKKPTAVKTTTKKETT